MNPSENFFGWVARDVRLAQFTPAEVRKAAVHVADRVAARHPHELDAVMPRLAGRLAAKDPAVAGRAAGTPRRAGADAGEAGSRMTRFAALALAGMAVCFTFSAACFWAGHRLRTWGDQ